MNYIELDTYPFAWVFRRDDLGLSPEDKAQIRPLTAQFAKQIWQREIGEHSVELDRLNNKDWLKRGDVWQTSLDWQPYFDAEETPLPPELSEHLVWNSETLVYIIYDAEHIIETRYSVFKRSWKAFLFAAEQALVIGRKRKEALWFIDEQTVKLGQRP